MSVVEQNGRVGGGQIQIAYTRMLFIPRRYSYRGSLQPYCTAMLMHDILQSLEKPLQLPRQ